ncbi:MAG: hypothetical protein VX549_14305 [Pseudomonadota bacterium]|nr:hypothetical protein [Pseudomonadota bacterium]
MRLTPAVVFGLVLLGASGLATAQVLDVSPFVLATLEHDSNLLRSRADAPGGPNRRSDTVSRLALGVTAEFNPGLQQARLTGIYKPVWYRHFDQFDHDAYELDARWDWVAGRRFDGRLGVTAEREIDDFANRSAPEAGFVRRQGIGALGAYNLSPRWRLEAEARHDRRMGSGAADPGFDLRESVAVAGLFYQGHRIARLGVSATLTEGRFPQRVAGAGLATEYEQTSVDGQIVWAPSALSELDGTIGYTQRQQQPTSTRNYEGLTGRLAYRRRVSAKTRLSLLGYRRIYSAELQDANLTVDDGLRLEMDWSWSYKTQLRGAIEHRDVEFEAAGALAGAATQLREEIDLVSLTLAWQALERLGLRLVAEHESRTSSEPSRDYDAGVARLEIRLGF